MVHCVVKQSCLVVETNTEVPKSENLRTETKTMVVFVVITHAVSETKISYR